MLLKTLLAVPLELFIEHLEGGHFDQNWYTNMAAASFSKLHDVTCKDLIYRLYNLLSDPVAEAFGLIHRHPSSENFCRV